MHLLDRFRSKRPIDYFQFVRQKMNRYLRNKMPVSILPLIKREIQINGVPVKFVTHKQDKVLGARLRGELGEDLSFLSELKLLQKMIKPGSKVLDAGANIGAVAIVLAKVQPSASIYCFEPDPLNFSLLNINIVLNGVRNVFPFNFALGKNQQFIKMYLNPTNFGDHRSSKCDKQDLGENIFKESKTLILKVNPVEVLSENFGNRIFNSFDILKIDTQGADFEILESCIPLLHRGSIVSIEYSPYHLIANGTTKDEVEYLASEFSSVKKICPKAKSFELEDINVKQLLSYYEAEHKVYAGYYDIVMTY